MRRVHVLVFLLQRYLFLRSAAFVPSIVGRTASLLSSPSLLLYNSNTPVDPMGNSNGNVTSNTTTATSITTLLETSTNSNAAAAPQFGDVVSMRRPSSSPSPKEEDLTVTAVTLVTATDSSSVAAIPSSRRQTNDMVAIASIALAVLNYAWQWTHPLTPIQLLYTMEQNSAPITVIGAAGSNKPTVVDFWAPWCENCKEMAATLEVIEDEYAGKVNFVMVNGDNPKNWPLIEAFGVDAIPHLALAEADGTVEMALIGPVPKRWLQEDLNTLIGNSRIDATTPRQALPY